MTDEDALSSIRRWHDSGGVVEILSLRHDEAVVSLRTCDAGEEMTRLRSTDPAVLRWIDQHIGDDSRSE
ncbi:MAG: hypothetical protein CME34_21685 [Gordonia sp.]|nr:hypothetical protein [Gordonia sp. (in: high G+C Gram-positive bacteria)]